MAKNSNGTGTRPPIIRPTQTRESALAQFMEANGLPMARPMAEASTALEPAPAPVHEAVAAPEAVAPEPPAPMAEATEPEFVAALAPSFAAQAPARHPAFASAPAQPEPPSAPELVSPPVVATAPPELPADIAQELLDDEVEPEPEAELVPQPKSALAPAPAPGPEPPATAQAPQPQPASVPQAPQAHPQPKPQPSSADHHDFGFQHPREEAVLQPAPVPAPQLQPAAQSQASAAPAAATAPAIPVPVPVVPPFERPVQRPAKPAPQPAVPHKPVKAVRAPSLAGRWTRSAIRAVARASADTWIVAGCSVLVLATQFTMMWLPEVGVFLNVVTLVVLGIVSMLRDDLRKVGISLAILPVVNMVSASIPTTSTFRTASVFYGLMLVLALLYRYMFTLDQPLAVSRMRLRGYMYGLPLMLILGQAFGAMGFGFLRYHFPYQGISWPLLVVSCIIFAFAEEFFLRGLVQKHLAKVASPGMAVALCTAFYVSLAFNRAVPATLVPALLIGLTLALIYRIRQNLLLTTAFNAISKLVYLGLVVTFIWG